MTQIFKKISTGQWHIRHIGNVHWRPQFMPAAGIRYRPLSFLLQDFSVLMIKSRRGLLASCESSLFHEPSCVTWVCLMKAGPDPRCCHVPSSFHLSWIPVLSSFLSRRLFAHRWVCFGGNAQASFGTASGVLTGGTLAMLMFPRCLTPCLIWVLQLSPQRAQKGLYQLVSCWVRWRISFKKESSCLRPLDQYTLELALELRSDSHFGVACLSAVPCCSPTVWGHAVHLSPCWGRVSREVV